MNLRMKKFLSFYKPYMGIFLVDMFCAFAVAAVTLIYPLVVRYITNDLLVNCPKEQIGTEIAKLAVMLMALFIINAVCNYYITCNGICVMKFLNITRNCRLVFMMIKKPVSLCPVLLTICLILQSFATMDRRI